MTNMMVLVLRIKSIRTKSVWAECTEEEEKQLDNLKD